MSSSHNHPPCGSPSSVTTMPSITSNINRKSHQRRNKNTLSIRVILDQSFLRDGSFAEMTLRIPDQSNLPRHSKVALGACVATSFGLGVLVGWRVEDDCHVVRSLWQHRGSGSALAYLRRDCIHGVVQAAVGFDVETTMGRGKVLSYHDGGRDFLGGRFFVTVKQHGRHWGRVLEFPRGKVLSCPVAKFSPVLEQIKASALYQIQMDCYKNAVRQANALRKGRDDDDKWKFWSDGFELFLASFVKAVADDPNFDDELNEFLNKVISLLEGLGKPSDVAHHDDNDDNDDSDEEDEDSSTGTVHTSDDSQNLQFSWEVSNKPKSEDDSISEADPGPDWIKDLFGGLFQKDDPPPSNPSEDQFPINEDAPSTHTDIFAGLFKKGMSHTKTNPNSPPSLLSTGSPSSTRSFDSHDIVMGQRPTDSYGKAFAVIRTLMRTVAIARASSPNKPNLQMGLTMCHEILLFIRTVIRVQRKNMSPKSLDAWKKVLADIVKTFGPMKRRLNKFGQGVFERVERMGNKAKIRVLRFVDVVLSDEKLFFAAELGDWDRCIAQLEYAAVQANMFDEASCRQYHQTAMSLYNTFLPRDNAKNSPSKPSQNRSKSANKSAANNTQNPQTNYRKNGEKLTQFAHLLKFMATPRRSTLRLFTRDDVLEAFERILVRVFRKDAIASRMLIIHSFHFRSFRHLRLLNNVSISGPLWTTLLEATREELSILVSKIPEPAREFAEPVVRLFRLGVETFHRIRAGNSKAEWLDFLMEEEAVGIIQEMDAMLRSQMEGLCKDVQDMMVILPYYSSIDEDILNLIDDFELDKILQEAAEALVDEKRFPKFLKEKSALAVSRFLDYLPKISIPVERRELGEGWVLTCRSKEGGHLRLSEIKVQKENLICQVIGSNVLSPMLVNENPPDPPERTLVRTNMSSTSSLCRSVNTIDTDEEGNIEVSILDSVAELISNAHRHGCYKPGLGGVGQVSSDKPIPPALQGLPVSEVITSGLELWQNLEIDDDELMEIAIRDVSYQIQLQKDQEEEEILLADHQKRMREDSFASASSPSDNNRFSSRFRGGRGLVAGSHCRVDSDAFTNTTRPPTSYRKSKSVRFNPRKDPTVLFLEMKNLSCHLDEFQFCVEPQEKFTPFDPVFEGRGCLHIQNVSLKLRVECRKERIERMGQEVVVPVLQLNELDISLEMISIKFRDTGADWLLNKVVSGFRKNIVEVINSQAKEQIAAELHKVLEQINTYIEANPELLLKILGITIDDLEENIVLV